MIELEPQLELEMVCTVQLYIQETMKLIFDGG